MQVRDLHTQRAALEREYASKLQLLVRKASEKKAKKMAEQQAHALAQQRYGSENTGFEYAQRQSGPS